MREKKLWIIGIQETLLETISKQAKVVLGDHITIDMITVKDIQANTIDPHDIVVISAQQIKGLVSRLIPETCPIIVGKRDINYVNSKRLLNLSPGQNILVVNDNKENTEETVLSLRKTIFEHHYIGYIPEEPMPEDIDYIVTPGETKLLPKGLPNVIDLGNRVLDFQTFESIMNTIGVSYTHTDLVARYLKSCVSIIDNENQKNINLHDARNTAGYTFNDFIAVSEKMKQTIDRAKSFACDRMINRILLEGEPGTGKGMLAQAIHNYSPKSERPFITIDCSLKDSQTIERELFGSEQDGELTYGVFELVTDGTICIREISSLSLALQEKIGNVLEKGSFVRIKGSEEIPLHSRVILTISNNVEELVKQGILLPELYQFLSEYSLRVPPLRERREDLVPLINDIKARLNHNLQLNQEVMAYFNDYYWPENVRELYNTITYLTIKKEDMIGIESLPFYHHTMNHREKFIIQDDIDTIIEKIENHGFLEESIEILKVFYEGKKNYTSFGRNVLKQYLDEKGLEFSEQQLRARLEVLQKLGLTIVRQGRAGSTISRKGERFLKLYKQMS